MNTAYCNFCEISFHVDLCDGLTKFPVPLLVEENFNLKFEIESLNVAISNVESKFHLADFAFKTDRE